MLINPNEINKILSISGTKVTAKGKKYFEQSRVKVANFNMTDEENYISKSYVEGTYIYNVKISKEKSKLTYSCNCPASLSRTTPCKHIIAAFFNMYINEDEYLLFKEEDNNLINTNKLYNNYTQKINLKINNNSIVNYYENLEIYETSKGDGVNLIPILEIVPLDNKFNLSFQIGKEKMYKLKDLLKFYECMIQKEKYKYGKDLDFVHDLKNFTPNSQEIVKFVVKRMNEYDEYSKLGSYYFNVSNRYKGIIRLSYGALDDFFSIYNNESVIIEGTGPSNTSGMITFVDEDPKFEIEVQEVEDGIEISQFNDDYYMFNGQDYLYVLFKDKLHRCSNDFKENIYPLLKELKSKNENTIFIPSNDCASFCEYVVPRIKKVCPLSISDSILNKYKPEELDIKTYLDIDENLDVICDVRFCYGKIEINPFDGTSNIKCNRNVLKEKKANKIFRDNNFVIDTDKKRIYLNNENDIYNFLTDGINLFNLNFNVYITDRLKKRQIIKPKTFAIGVKVDNELLNLDISKLNFSNEELKGIFKSYTQKKKYYRLKNGAFISLESEEIDTLVNLAKTLNISDFSKGEIQVPKFRALYLDKLASDNKLIINKDKSFEKLISDITNSSNLNFKLPDNFNGNLREYQKVGFNWLKVLDKYNFGGILADEMGLGKTIQLIALLLDEKNNNVTSKRYTSIVVCPSSLYLNWKKEINKFAPTLDVIVINGNAEERKAKINELNNYDVAITSYDMLKRDIEKYKDFNFRYIIADEAQYIKNSNTKNSKSLKKLNGITKFALTGTPIENSLSELWSIFDFCMKGYLYSYPKFKDNYEIPIVKDDDKNAIKKLEFQIKPFILRRIKKDVLKELPLKTETVLYSSMEEEQRKIYEAYLLKAKNEMKNLLDNSNFEKNKLQILSLITRLRQICCHPSLFLSNYTGTSSKMIQCLDILNNAILSGHKVLLFSQFTSMLDILKKELDESSIPYMELTGKTKSDKRLEMVNKFNTENDVKVFLISLKAGGTGLNLIGADIVIHFDPWWNISVQNQATDRAHRIGQKKNVQVFKLITENTIEEKIEKLQERKINLSNNIVKTGENFINKMSKEEIMHLFD